jgi:hypothetical protein
VWIELYGKTRCTGQTLPVGKVYQLDFMHRDLSSRLFSSRRGLPEDADQNFHLLFIQVQLLATSSPSIQSSLFLTVRLRSAIFSPATRYFVL